MLFTARYDAGKDGGWAEETKEKKTEEVMVAIQVVETEEVEEERAREMAVAIEEMLTAV